MKKRLRTAVLDDVRKETKLRKIKIQEDQKKTLWFGKSILTAKQ